MADLCPNIINFNAAEFSERHSEEITEVINLSKETLF